MRFLLRYVLMALGAYVIFTVSPASLYGLFAGLFLPVAAIACEAAYETLGRSDERHLASGYWLLASSLNPNELVARMLKRQELEARS